MVSRDGGLVKRHGGDRPTAVPAPADAGAAPLVELRRVSCRRGRTLALDRVDLRLAPGELHAVAGGRGAGKSTLLRLLAGLEWPVGGEVLVHGEPRQITSSRAALRLGVGAMLDRPAVVETLSVADNVVLGSEPGRLLLGRRRAAERVASLGDELGLALDPRARVSTLTAAARRQVELLALVHRGASVLLLDDWVGDLGEGPAEQLLTALARLRATGRAVLVATRPTGRLLELADRVTGLEDGRPTGDPPAPRPGTPVTSTRRAPSRPARGEPLLQVKGLWVADQGEARVASVDLDVRHGEIYGLAGAPDEGQAALIEAVVGLCRTESGRIYLGDEDVTGASVAARRQCGLAYLPAPRQPGGLIGPLALWENVAVGQQGRPRFRRHRLLDRRALRAAAGEQAATVAVREAHPDLSAWRLTPGEQQRLVLARELAAQPTLLVAARPTHGLDRASTAVLWRRLRQEARAGLAVLLWSSDREELLALADRVGVMADGRVAGELDATQLGDADLARADALAVGQGGDPSRPPPR
jgi:general nucleoside transport system ATP-binding protein